MHQFLVRRVRPAVTQVVSDRSGEEPCFLLDISDMISEMLLCHLSDVCSIQPDASRCHIVESEHQKSDGGFTASRTADDRCCLAAPAGKVQSVECILLRIRKAE